MGNELSIYLVRVHVYAVEKANSDSPHDYRWEYDMSDPSKTFWGKTGIPQRTGGVFNTISELVEDLLNNVDALNCNVEVDFRSLFHIRTMKGELSTFFHDLSPEDKELFLLLWKQKEILRLEEKKRKLAGQGAVDARSG